MQDQLSGRHSRDGVRERRPPSRLTLFLRWFDDYCLPRLRFATQLVAVLFFAALCLGAAALGVGNATTLNDRVYWGTFTQTRCEPIKDGCDNYGTWVSDDGSIVKKDTELLGSSDDNRTFRASYRPTGFDNDAEHGLVHTGALPGDRFWGQWAFSLGSAAFGFFVARQWGSCGGRNAVGRRWRTVRCSDRSRQTRLRPPAPSGARLA